MLLKEIKLVPLIILFLFFYGCKGEIMKDQKIYYKTIKDIPIASWEQLAQKKIYFGHRSVGNNIIDGIHELMDEYPQLKLNIVKTKDEKDFNRGIFAHSLIGENTKPLTKIDAFMEIMDNGLGNTADIVFLKFCFVDVQDKTDIGSLFENYKKSMEGIKTKYPETTIVHFTVPLVTLRTSWKTWFKVLMDRKKIWEYDHIIRKNEYNELIRQEYKGKEPLFDIAEVESVKPDGSKHTFSRNGKTYNSMVPLYTNDSGHLNKMGRKIVAEQLLLFLVNLN